MRNLDLPIREKGFRVPRLLPDPRVCRAQPTANMMGIRYLSRELSHYLQICADLRTWQTLQASTLKGFC